MPIQVRIVTYPSSIGIKKPMRYANGTTCSTDFNELLIFLIDFFCPHTQTSQYYHDTCEKIRSYKTFPTPICTR